MLELRASGRARSRRTTSSTGRKREPYVESDAPNPLSIYGRTKLQAEAAAGENAWIMCTSWLHGWTSTNFLRTMLDLGAGARRGGGGRRPTRLAHLRRAPGGRGAGVARSPRGGGTSRVTATAHGPSSLKRSSKTPESTAAVKRITTAELERPRRGPRTRCYEASGPMRRRCRTGAKACAPVSSACRPSTGTTIGRNTRRSRQIQRAVLGNRTERTIREGENHVAGRRPRLHVVRARSWPTASGRASALRSTLQVAWLAVNAHWNAPPPRARPTLLSSLAMPVVWSGDAPSATSAR